jgi:hypothetical protein
MNGQRCQEIFSDSTINPPELLGHIVLQAGTAVMNHRKVKWRVMTPLAEPRTPRMIFGHLVTSFTTLGSRTITATYAHLEVGGCLACSSCHLLHLLVIKLLAQCTHARSILHV